MGIDTLRDAIWEHPDDDAPRLVHADELGDARGELIVVQCALAAGDDRVEIARRDIELLRAHGEAWTAPLGPISEAVFHRGFIETLAMPVDVFVDANPFAYEPIEHLRLTRPKDWQVATECITRAAQRPELARLRRLDLPAWVERDAWLAVVRSPHLANLRVLTARDASLEDDAFAAFTADTTLAALESLRIDTEDTNLTNEIGDGLRTLALPHLRELSLHAQWSSEIADSLVAFARGPGFARLERLDVHGHHGLPVAAIRAVLDRPQLRALGAGMCGLGAEHAEALVTAPGAAALASLELADTRLEVMLDVLARAALPALLDLDVSVGNAPPGWQPSRFGELAPLFASSWLPALETLRLDGRRLGDAGVAALAARPLPALRALTLANVGLTDDGLAALVRARLPALEVLDIGGNDALGERGLAELARAPWFHQLRWLRLPTVFAQTVLDAPALRVLAIGAPVELVDTSRLPRLRELRVPRQRRDRIRARTLAPGAWPDRIFGQRDG